MSKEIDERIVSMQFDNKRFESNVQTTINSVEKLQDKLNFKGATKGLETIDAASKKINMSGLVNSVETVGLKFNAMYSVADQTLRDITKSAIAAGKKIGSALTIDPIKTGLKEYETQINAVQTILANTQSKGTTLDDVNGALDELNSYADKTIYNFTEMTRNIGTFTAAGVDLDTATNAIQGIANLAAVSGSTSQQASTAMYQLSQALSSGTVKLMDWNSVVNAGMGGQVFQDALKETARVHGINIDQMIEKQGSFRETLQEGWLSSEILTETLQKFTLTTEGLTEAQVEQNRQMLKSKGYTDDQINAIFELGKTATDAATKVKTFTQLTDTLKEAAQSGWTQTWELIIGDFEQAKGLWTSVSDVVGGMINDSAEARNNLLEGALTSNWDKLVKKINEAGVETSTFESKLKDVSKAHGVDIDALVEEHGSLEKAFKSGAVSSDILKESVKGLSGSLVDLKSINRTLEIGNTGEDVKKIQEALKLLKFDIGEAGVDGSLGPDTERAIKAFQQANGLEVTGIVDEKTLATLEEATGKVGELSGSVDGLIDGITKLGGRELLIESLKNAFKGIMSVVKPIKEAFREIFPPVTSTQIYNLIEGFKNFTDKLILSKEASDNLKRTFKGVFAILDIVRQAFVAIFKAILPLFGGLGSLGGSILDVTASWGDWLVKLNETIKSTDFFTNAVEKIRQTLSTAYKAIYSFFEPVIEKAKEFGNVFGNTFSSVADKADRGFAPFKVIGAVVLGLFKAIGAIISKMAPWLAKFASMAGNVFTDLMDQIASSIQDADYNKLFDLLNGGIFAAIGVGIARFTNSLGGITKDAKGFLDNINDILEGVGDALSAFTMSIKVKAIKEIATAIAILAASLFVISIIDSEKLTGALGAITIMFAELMGSMSLFSKIADGTSLKSMFVLSSALKSISTALLIMAIALKIMSTMSWDELKVGLTALTTCLGLLVAAVNLLPEKKVNGAAKAIKKISTSMVILAVALKIMGSMSWKEMGVGLISMAVGLGVMVAAINLLPKDTGLRAAGMVGLATSMVILGAALKIMGSMSWKEMGIGLLTLTGALAAITIALRLMPKNTLITSVGLLGVATAITIMAGALKIMGSMSLPEIGKGLLALGGSLAIVAIGVNAMKGALPGAAALLVVAAAIAVFAPMLMLLGSMSMSEIIKSLVTLAGVFAVVGIAGLLLQPIIPAILGLSAAVALLGIGCTAVGIGVMAFAAGIAALSVALSAGGGAIVLFVSSLIGLIPYFIKQVGVGIVELCKVIAGSAAAICEAVAVIIVALVDSLGEAIPVLVEGVLELLVSLLETLITYIPQLVPLLVDLLATLVDMLVENMPVIMESVFKLLTAIIEGITANISMIIEPLVELFGAVFQGIADTIGPIINEIIAPLLEVLTGLFVDLFEVIAPYIPDICDLFTQLATIVTNAIVRIMQVVSPYIPSIVSAIKSICDAFKTVVNQIAPIINSITGLIKQLGESLVEIITSISDVISDIGVIISETFKGIEDIIYASSSVINEVFQGIGTVIAEIGGAIESSLNGLSGAFDSAFNGISKVVDSISGGITDILEGFADIIDSIGDAALNSGTGFEKLANGIKTITKLNIADMTASLAAVAAGLAEIKKNGSGLSKAGLGIDKILDAITVTITSCGNMSSIIDTLIDKLLSIGNVTYQSTTKMAASVEGVYGVFGTLSTTISSETTNITNSIEQMGTICVSSIEGLKGSLETAGQTLVGCLAEAINSAGSGVAQSFTSFMRNVIVKIAGSVSLFSSVGVKLMGAFAKGIRSGLSMGISAVVSATNTMASTARLHYASFYSAGVYLVAGLAAGIRNSKSLATSAAQSVADAVESIIRSAWKINSPSKVFYKIALGIGEGINNALVDSVYEVKNATEGLADTTTTGFGRVIQKISEVIGSDIDSQPTITPVLDLSNVTAGASAISGLFSGKRTLSVDTSAVGAIASSMAQRQNGMDTSDVVSSIKALRKDLANMPRESININGITYDDGSNITDAVQTIVRAAKIEGRV